MEVLSRVFCVRLESGTKMRVLRLVVVYTLSLEADDMKVMV